MMRLQKQCCSVMISAILLGTSSSLDADTIALRPSVRLPHNANTITLGDIADLDGPEAMSFAALPVAKTSDSCDIIELSINEIRALLDEAGAHWGRVNLSGRNVIVRPARTPGTAAPPLAMAAVALDQQLNRRSATLDEETSYSAGTLVSSPTLRGVIANLLVTNLKIAPDKLRIRFDQRDRALLDTPTSSARLEVQPLGSFASDRIELAVRTWTDSRGGRQVRTISVHPQIRVRAAVLRADVPRGHVIAESDIEAVDEWMNPGVAGLSIDPVSAIGRVTTKTLKAGDVLRHSHVQRDALIKRGDRVVVRCLVGGVAISLQAEARADGFEGETIEFRKQGERETFLATVTAKGEAIVDLSRAPVSTPGKHETTDEHG